ncbi:MAG TPA: hypothetical protein VK034_13755 [Enhygromyxa sp.]|nr:hypothetical protein [Enhygromyxa sp.]
MTRESICCIAALVGLLATTVQGVGCEAGCEEDVAVGAGEYRITKASTIGDDEEWLADALVDRQLDIDRENNVATLIYTHDGTTYQVRFAIDE